MNRTLAIVATTACLSFVAASSAGAARAAQVCPSFKQGGVTYFSAESPDVACHEMGHAVLDAVRPQLWNAQSIEAAAFHESFGDMTAILSALQVPSFAQPVFNETHGNLGAADVDAEGTPHFSAPVAMPPMK